MPFIFRPGGTNRPLLKQIPYYTAFSPLSIGGCSLWLDAADVSTITGTSPMTARRDKSGVNTTPTYTGSPTYRTTSALRLGCVTFNGTTSFNSGTDSLYWSGFSLNQPFTVFVVATKRLSSNPNYSFVVEPSTGSGAVLLFANLQLSMYAGSADQYTNPVLSFVANTTRLYSAVFNGSSSLLAYNGNATSPLSPGGNSWPGLYLGRDWSGAYDSGDYGEILFYNSALGTTQRQQIESYLAQKWGLTTTLPSTHLNATRPAGIPAVSFINRKGFNLIAALLSGFMSTVYNLSSYSLALIANSVAASSGTVSYIWTVAVPSGAKGKNAILMLFFNLYSLTNFLANQYFDYGIYVDGVAQGFGDTGTTRYIQTALGNYALNNGGITYGTNAMSPYQPLIIPLVLAAGATTIQLGIKNSSAALSYIASVAPDTTNPTAYTSPGQTTYTVPTTSSGVAVTGVYIYAWGSGGGPGGATFPNGTSPAGAGGYAYGFYSCATGTALTVITGGITTGAYTVSYGSGGGGFQGQAAGGGGYSGVFSSTNIVQSNTILIAGGGGGGSVNGYAQCGGGGGGTSGTSWYNPANATFGGGNDGLGGLSNAVQGSNTGQAALQGGHTYGGGGGGWYGGGVGAFGSEHPGGGGSGYIGGYGTGIGVTSGGVMSNGSTGTTAPISAGTGSNIQAGGSTIMTARGYSPTTYAHGGGGNGLVVIIPAIGTNPVSVGVSAQLYSA